MSGMPTRLRNPVPPGRAAEAHPPVALAPKTLEAKSQASHDERRRRHQQLAQTFGEQPRRVVGKAHGPATNEGRRHPYVLDESSLASTLIVARHDERAVRLAAYAAVTARR